MSWDRTVAVPALVNAIDVASGGTVFVFDRPPTTLNPPAVVVGRPVEVLYATAGFSVDETTLPVLCVGAAEDDDTVDDLIGVVRAAVKTPGLGGAAQSCVASAARNWRNVVLAGVEILQAEVILTIQM